MRIHDDYTKLLAQNERLQQNVVQAHPVSEREKSGSSVAPLQTSETRGGRELHQEPALESQPVAVEPRHLILSDTTVKPIAGGLMATMRFSPNGTSSLGELALIVCLPKDGDCRILDLVPTDSMKYSEVAKRVSEDGKFAIFKGTPEAITDMQFGLTVSRPVTADVRGTCGIEAFQLDIQTTGTTIRRN